MRAMATNELTDADINRYIETDGSNCPFYASDALYLGAVRGGTGIAFRDITCRSCNKTWREIFYLAEIQYPAREDFARIERPGSVT